MIKVTVELWPGGFEEYKRTIATATIINDASSPEHPRRGNYDVEFTKPGGKRRRGRVENFPRKSRDVWELIRRALNEVNS